MFLPAVILTYKYRVLPNKRQHRALEGILESQRQLYNAALQERTDAYRKAGISRSYYDQCCALTTWRREDPEARIPPANLQRHTLKRVDTACVGFMGRVRRGERPGFPRFQGFGRFKSFGFRQFSGITLKGRRLRFRGLPGGLRVHFHRPLPCGGPIKECIFRRQSNGWFVAFAVEVPVAPIRPAVRVVGMDLGISGRLAVLSDGGLIPGLRAARRGERRLRVAERALSRKQRGSKRRTKARVQLARCHAQIARRRSNHLNAASTRLIRDYDVIVHEAVNLRGLLRSDFARDLYDASWGSFIGMLRYKAEKAGARIIEVDGRNTTQDCSNCGVRVPKNIHVRVHHCPSCGLTMDRDLNAARNVLHRAGVSPGLPNVVECGMRAGGNLDFKGIEPLPISLRSTKP